MEFSFASVIIGIAGWFLGIITRPYIERKWIRIPRIAISYDVKIDQPLMNSSRELSSLVNVDLIFQNHSDYDAHGFSIESIVVESESNTQLNFKRSELPVLISKDKDHTIKFNYYVLLEKFPNHQRFEHSIPKVLDKGPFSIIVEYTFKNSLGKTFNEEYTFVIRDKNQVKEGHWMGGWVF